MLSHAVLMRNNSHSPGCIRAFPASQSCQVRRVEWMSRAAADCDSPDTSLAALISSLDGLAEGAFAPLLRFGWFGTLVDREFFAVELLGVGSNVCVQKFLVGAGSKFAVQALADFVIHQIDGSGKVDLVVVERNGHFFLLAPVPEARRIRCIHELYSTRNPCICKDYLQ